MGLPAQPRCWDQEHVSCSCNHTRLCCAPWWDSVSSAGVDRGSPGGIYSGPIPHPVLSWTRQRYHPPKHIAPVHLRAWIFIKRLVYNFKLRSSCRIIKPFINTIPCTELCHWEDLKQKCHLQIQTDECLLRRYSAGSKEHKCSEGNIFGPGKRM